MNIVMIAEKPSVAQTYASALDLEGEKKQNGYIEGHSKWDDNDYKITWSVGHLVTLSMPDKYDEKYKKWIWDDLPFLPTKYKYDVIQESSKQFGIVKKLYNSDWVQQIIYAGDSGREGLYIQYLIKMLAGNNGKATEKVLWIDSQTTDEIRKGLQIMKPLSAYARMKDAGVMRAISDYAFGMNYSRMLSIKFGHDFNDKIKSKKYKPISVGRVMTCVLGMVVDRERQIRDFNPTVFYKIFANCTNGVYEFSADWIVDKESTYYDSILLHDNKGFLQISDALSFINKMNLQKLMVADVTDKITKQYAPLLFNLAELQSECSKRFKIDPAETLKIVQELYEKRLTTYPRTDARFLSTAVAKEIDRNLKGLKNGSYKTKYIEQILQFGMYGDIEKTKYTNDEKITDHYAIIPTGNVNTNGLSDLAINVYHLIVDRFICIFMPHAEFSKSTVTLIAPNKEKFTISEKILVKTGYLQVLSDTDQENDEGSKLSDFLKKGDEFDAEFSIEEGKTSPPNRYTTGSIILAMENAGNLIEDPDLRAQIKGSGIGTSATRAEILSKLQKIEYIKVNKKTQIITPHEDGEIIYDIVKSTIPSFLSPKMTASWEKGLTQIEEGITTKEIYQQLLEKNIKSTFDKLSKIPSSDSNNSAKNTFTPQDTGYKCPYCEAPIITTRVGYKCSNYKRGKDGCSFYISKICGYPINDIILKELLTREQTRVLPFVSDKGKMFTAALKINKTEKKIDFIF